MYTYATTFACRDCRGPLVRLPPGSGGGESAWRPFLWYLVIASFVFVLGLYAFSTWAAVVVAVILGLGAYFGREKRSAKYHCPRCNRTLPNELAQFARTQADA
jgi:Flp pilus assembly protein TadB